MACLQGNMCLSCASAKHDRLLADFTGHGEVSISRNEAPLAVLMEAGWVDTHGPGRQCQETQRHPAMCFKESLDFVKPPFRVLRAISTSWMDCIAI